MMAAEKLFVLMNKGGNRPGAGYLVEIFATAFTISTEIHMGKETA